MPLASERTGDFSQSWPEDRRRLDDWSGNGLHRIHDQSRDPDEYLHGDGNKGYEHLAHGAGVPEGCLQQDSRSERQPTTSRTNWIRTRSCPASRTSSTTSTTVVRIDQQFGQKVTVFYRYMHDTFPETLPAGQFTTVPIPGTNTTTVVNPGTQHLATEPTSSAPPCC